MQLAIVENLQRSDLNPIEEAKAHLKDLCFTVPFCREVKEQSLSGKLWETVSDKRFNKRMREIAERVVNDGQE